LPDRRRIHIVEFEKFYKIHWDWVSPYENPLKHLRKDARHWYDLLIDALDGLSLNLNLVRVEAEPSEGLDRA